MWFYFTIQIPWLLFPYRYMKKNHQKTLFQIKYQYIHIKSAMKSPNNKTWTIPGLAIGTGGAQPLNGALPSLPSPTMPTFNMAAQTTNGQPPPQDSVYTNGIHQTFTGRKTTPKAQNYPKLTLAHAHDVHFRPPRADIGGASDGTGLAQRGSRPSARRLPRHAALPRRRWVPSHTRGCPFSRRLDMSKRPGYCFRKGRPLAGVNASWKSMGDVRGPFGGRGRVVFALKTCFPHFYLTLNFMIFFFCDFIIVLWIVINVEHK